MQYSRSMYHDKIKYYVYPLLILLNLYGQEKEQDEKKSFFWGLIKIDNKRTFNFDLLGRKSKIPFNKLIFK